MPVTDSSDRSSKLEVPVEDVCCMSAHERATSNACAQDLICDKVDAEPLRTIKTVLEPLSYHRIYCSFSNKFSNSVNVTTGSWIECVRGWDSPIQARRVRSSTPIFARLSTFPPFQRSIPLRRKILSLLATCLGVSTELLSNSSEKTIEARCRLRVRMMTARTAA